MGLLDAHLAWCALRNLRTSTIDQRRYAILRLERALGGPAVLLEAPALLEWYKSLELTAEARACELSHIRQFYKWLRDEGHRPDDPTIRLIRPRLTPRLPRPMTSEDLDIAVRTAPERVRPMLLCAAYAGLRACEIAPLRREDVREEVLLVADGKGGRQRVLPLHPVLRDELSTAQLAVSGLLFRSTRRNGPLPAHRVSQLVNEHLHSLGISATLHQVRHWFGTNVYQMTLDLRLTQDLMGHASPVTTAGYAAWTPRGIDMLSRLTIGHDDVGAGRVSMGGFPSSDAPAPIDATLRPDGATGKVTLAG